MIRPDPPATTNYRTIQSEIVLLKGFQLEVRPQSAIFYDSIVPHKEKFIVSEVLSDVVSYYGTLKTE